MQNEEEKNEMEIEELIESSTDRNDRSQTSSSNTINLNSQSESEVFENFGQIIQRNARHFDNRIVNPDKFVEGILNFLLTNEMTNKLNGILVSVFFKLVNLKRKIIN